MTTPEDIHGSLEKSLVEAELTAALRRLEEKIVKGQSARISYSAVAREANRSRTLIGYDGCAYPDVREAVAKAIKQQNGLEKPGIRSLFSANALGQHAHRSATGVETDPDDPLRLVVQLKERVAELLKQNRTAAVKIVTIDDENQQLREQVTRLKSELARRKTSSRS